MSDDQAGEAVRGLLKVYCYDLPDVDTVTTVMGVDMRRHNASHVRFQAADGNPEHYTLTEVPSGWVGVKRSGRAFSWQSPWEMRTDTRTGQVIGRIQLRRNLRCLDADEADLLRRYLTDQFGLAV